MHQTASDVEPEHFPPTTVSGDSNLVYKFLDSNLFAVSVVNEDAKMIQIFIVNGISGKVVYKFSESSVATKEPFDMLLAENQFILAFKRASSAYGNLPR